MLLKPVFRTSLYTKLVTLNLTLGSMSMSPNDLTFVFRQSESSSDLDFRQYEDCHTTFTQGHDIELPSPMSRLSYDIHSKS